MPSVENCLSKPAEEATDATSAPAASAKAGLNPILTPDFLEYESTNANRGLNVLKHVLYSCFKTVFYARVLKHVLKHDNPGYNSKLSVAIAC